MVAMTKKSSAFERTITKKGREFFMIKDDTISYRTG